MKFFAKSSEKLTPFELARLHPTCKTQNEIVSASLHSSESAPPLKYIKKPTYIKIKCYIGFKIYSNINCKSTTHLESPSGVAFIRDVFF